MHTAIIGAGSWGTTIGIMLAGRGEEVVMWDFRPEAANRMEKDRENKEFLPGYPFPPSIRVTSDIHASLDGAETAIFAVPTHVTRETASRLADGFPKDCIVVSATKGIEQGSLMRVSELLQDVWGDTFDSERFVTLSGPSHAEEVVNLLPTSVVAASVKLDAAEHVQKLLSGNRFRVYAHDDVIGVELGGSLKNVIAIASGMAYGLGFGDNTTGALLTRGLAEINRLGVVLGGRPETFAGLSGMGDLITTCCSPHSRNRYVGEQLGRGRKLKEILDSMVMVAEGVRTTESAWELGRKHDVDMPITEQVYRILFEDADPLIATTELMTRRLKLED